nr:30S ribosomal protein S1 [Desulfobacterales bacterium]
MVNITTNAERDETTRMPADAAAEAKEAGQDAGEPSMMMYEDSFGQFKEGEVVTGVITSVDKDLVLVD